MEGLSAILEVDGSLRKVSQQYKKLTEMYGKSHGCTKNQQKLIEGLPAAQKLT